MKKYLVSIFTILFMLPAFAAEESNFINFSGKVLDENNDPLVGVAVTVTGTTTGDYTNTDGTFSINVDKNNMTSDTKLNISYMGYETQLVSPTEYVEVKLEPSVMDDVIIVACQPDTAQGIKRAIFDKSSQECKPAECVSDRYILTNKRTVTLSDTATPYICLGSTNEGGPCEDFCVASDSACTTIQIGDSCEDQVGKDCNTNDRNATSAIYEWADGKLTCKIQKCNDGYLPNDAGTGCVASEGPCSDSKLAELEHAIAGEYKNGKCYATECEAGYEISNGKCIAISGNCKPMPENAVSAHREWDSNISAEVCIIDSCKDGYSISNDKKSCITPTLSEEDSKAKIAELQENADAMKEKEQSTANKLLGAAGIGAMGIGGMQVASALAEQNADADAEREMAAYLATFKCDYGQGATIQGGESNITLPGANVLLPIYNEYTSLAADLKVRKEALGMTPGIESEVILDAATSGLYDNEGTGITDGAFTSLSRAMMDETSADAAEWAAQKADTSSQLKTGAIVAGAGALVGVVGNVLINEVGDKPKEISDEIIAKYEPLKKLRDNTAKLPDTEATAKCPSDSTGTYPNCSCTNNKYIHNANTNLCEACPGDKVAINNVCDCAPGTIPSDNNTCITPKTEVTAKCDTSAGHVTVDETTGECTCLDGYNLNTDQLPKCECPTDTHEVNSEGKCVEKTPDAPTQIVDAVIEEIIQPITLSTGNMFELNSYELTSDAKQTLNTFATDVKNAMKDDTNYCISITGHTDKSGSDAINIPLSEKRAEAVKQALVSSGIQSNNITAKGVGSSQCKSNKTYDKDCRKVEVKMSNSSCQS